MKRIFFCLIFLGVTACLFTSNLYSQCHVTVQDISRLSNEELQITVQGNTSHDCNQIKIHWINPSLPDKIINVNINNDDLNVDNTWSVTYGSSDGLTLSMLENNFTCGNTNFSLEVTCVDDPQCQVTLPQEGMSVHCKQTTASCSIADIDLHCNRDGNGGLTAEASVSGTQGVSMTVVMTVIRNGTTISTATVTDEDGFITVTNDLEFQTGDYAVTCEITSPQTCRQSQSFQMTIANDSCQDSGGNNNGNDNNGDNNDNGNGNDNSCSTCQFCGGDWACCVAWVFVFISLFVLIAAILYVICDPTGAGGWGWLVLAISLIIFIASLWWIIENCDFNICRLLQVIAGALTVDISIICGVEGLIPCFSSAICGAVVIGGVTVRNWAILILIGILLIFGIQVICPGA